jgi:hypothetical protein
LLPLQSTLPKLLYAPFACKEFAVSEPAGLTLKIIDT